MIKKDKRRVEIEKQCWKIFSYCLHKLGITNYKTYFYFPGDEPFIKVDNAGMSIEIVDPYRCINLHIQEKTYNEWRKLPKAELNHSILHEVVHILTHTFWKLSNERFINHQQLNEANEDLVDKLTIIFQALGIFKGLK